MRKQRRRSWFAHHGFVCSVNDLPFELSIFVFRFLSKNELMRVTGVCKAFQRYSMHNSLWRKLTPFINRPINCNVLQVYVSRF